MLGRCPGEDIELSNSMRWYVVRTRSNYEKKVSLGLTQKGIDNYLPAFHEIHRWKDRKKDVELPVFPGYLFFRAADSSESRVSVLRTEGAVSILGQGPKIEAVPDEEVDALRLLLASRLPCQSHPLMRAGAWVRIRCGPLKDLEGLLVRVKNETRLVLSITLLSQSVSTEVAAEDVQFVRSVPTLAPSRYLGDYHPHIQRLYLPT